MEEKEPKVLQPKSETPELTNKNGFNKIKSFYKTKKKYFLIVVGALVLLVIVLASTTVYKAGNYYSKAKTTKKTMTSSSTTTTTVSVSSTTLTTILITTTTTIPTTSTTVTKTVALTPTPSPTVTATPAPPAENIDQSKGAIEVKLTGDGPIPQPLIDTPANVTINNGSFSQSKSGTDVTFYNLQFGTKYQISVETPSGYINNAFSCTQSPCSSFGFQGAETKCTIELFARLLSEPQILYCIFKKK
jgi:hypothetical protein